MNISRDACNLKPKTSSKTIYRSANYDRPGECSPQQNCLWWHWLTLWQPERKSSSKWSAKTSVSVIKTVLLRTTLTRTIIIYRPMIWLLVSNHLQNRFRWAVIVCGYFIHKLPSQTAIKWNRHAWTTLFWECSHQFSLGNNWKNEASLRELFTLFWLRVSHSVVLIVCILKSPTVQNVHKI